MFKAAKGAGFRAGMAPARYEYIDGGLKVLATPKCPFTKRSQFLSRHFWHEGLHEGMMEKLTGVSAADRATTRWDWVGIALFIGLFIIFKVL